LGVNFFSDLSWDYHIDTVINKARPTMMKLKFLPKYLDMDAMKKAATSHFYGMLYYSSTIWPTEMTTSARWRKLNSIHYRAQRVSL